MGMNSINIEIWEFWVMYDYEKKDFIYENIYNLTTISHPIFYQTLFHHNTLANIWKKNFIFTINTIYISHSNRYESHMLCLIISCPEFKQKAERQEVVNAHKF